MRMHKTSSVWFTSLLRLPITFIKELFLCRLRSEMGTRTGISTGVQRLACAHFSTGARSGYYLEGLSGWTTELSNASAALFVGVDEFAE